MVRSDNHLSALRHIIYIIEKDFLIGLPGTTHNEEVVIFGKRVKDRELFGLCGNVGNTVETGVSHHLSAVDIQLFTCKKQIVDCLIFTTVDIDLCNIIDIGG